MARPKKLDADKRENRLTIYLTDLEKKTLTNVAQGRPMTQVVILAIKEWVDRLMNPPEALRVAKYANIMEQDKEMIRGFLCSNGHPFWIEWTQPTDPRCCPVCGSEREIKRIWDGTVRKGL